MSQSLRLSIVHNGIPDVLNVLIVSSQVEAALRITGLQGELECSLNVTHQAAKSNNTSKVLGLLVEGKRLIDEALCLKILSPPFVELRLSLSLHKLLKSIEVSLFTEHSWHFHFVGITLHEVSDCTIELTYGLEVLCERIVSIFQVDTVVLLSNFKSFVPFSTGLVKSAE
jgi:hypothetical protein